MARTKAHDTAQKQRALSVLEGIGSNVPTKAKHVPPQSRRAAEIANNEAKQEHAAHVLKALTQTLTARPVRSNAELIDRIQRYFDFCNGQRILPTVEGLALYIGYTRSTLWDMKTGRHKGFSDVTDFGGTTSDIVKRVIEILAAFDGTLALDGTIGYVPYIFRVCNYYNLIQKSTVSIEPPEEPARRPMTVDEICKNLPEIDESLCLDADASSYDEGA